jgi:vacuolar-type H+-ATPase subunit I/STV1
VIGIGIDKLADVLTGVSNVLNSRSNIDAVDKFMAAFTSLFNSTGGNNVFVYYYIFSNFWVVFDAAAMIFRVWEDRFKERESNVEALQTQQESDSQILETLEALSEVNARLAVLKDSLNSLVRRKDIQRKGLAALKQGFEKKTIYLHSGLDVMDDDSVDEEDKEEEDEDEGPMDEADEDGTEDANSSQEDTGTLSDNRQDTNQSILVNQEFGENDIPE